jgi:hypothetical protein
MPRCTHHIPFEVKCPYCFADAMAREAAARKAHVAGNPDRRAAPHAAVPGFPAFVTDRRHYSVDMRPHAGALA